MPAVDRGSIEKALKDLDACYTELRCAVAGRRLEADEARHYVDHSVADSVKPPELVMVNSDALIDTIGHLEVVIKALKRLPKKGNKRCW